MTVLFMNPGPVNHKYNKWNFSSEPQGLHLKIGIVGAGITGLAAAAALIRGGHDVEIFERSKFKNEVGAALGVSPNSTGILDALGFNYRRAKAVSLQETRIYDGSSMQETYRADWGEVPKNHGSELLSFHRVDLHQELRELALSEQAGLKPASIRLGSPVTSIDCESGEIFTENGEIWQKDVIIGADGIHSIVASSILEDHLSHIEESGQSAYRWLIPAETLYQDEDTKHVFKDSKVIIKIATVDDRRIVFYQCRGGEFFNFVGLHPTKVHALDEDGWQSKGRIEDLVKIYNDFDPALVKACRLAQDLKLWKLQAGTPIPRWSKGKAILLGDAAHPMLPHHAQAANMALEDIGATARLLSNVRSKDDIPKQLETIYQLRRNRTAIVQTVSNVPQDQADIVAEKVKPYLDGPLPKNPMEFSKFLFGYDLWNDVKTRMSV